MGVAAISFSACGVSMHCSETIYGITNINTFLGFSHALNIKAGRKEYNDDGIMVILHDAMPNIKKTEDRKYLTEDIFYKRSAQRDVGGKEKKTIFDSPEGSISCTIITNVPNRITDEELKLMVLKMKFGGGFICPDSIKVQFSVCGSSDIEEHCKQLLPKIEYGQVISSFDLNIEESNPFESFTESISLNSRLKPAMLGYILLEEPQENRKGIRTGVEKHAFVQHLLGCIEFKTVPQVIKENCIDSCLWFYKKTDNVIEFTTKKGN